MKLLKSFSFLLLLLISIISCSKEPIEQLQIQHNQEMQSIANHSEICDRSDLTVLDFPSFCIPFRLIGYIDWTWTGAYGKIATIEKDDCSGDFEVKVRTFNENQVGVFESNLTAPALLGMKYVSGNPSSSFLNYQIGNNPASNKLIYQNGLSTLFRSNEINLLNDESYELQGYETIKLRCENLPSGATIHIEQMDLQEQEINASGTTNFSMHNMECFFVWVTGTDENVQFKIKNPNMEGSFWKEFVLTKNKILGVNVDDLKHKYSICRY